MSGDALVYAPATELVARLCAGELKPSEVLEAHLDRIDAVNPALNAIVTLDIESAMCQAEQADQRLANGEPCAASPEPLA